MKTKKTTKLFEWQQKCKSGTEKCAKCGETRFLTVDHILPVFLIEQFVTDRLETLHNLEENFEILCKWCNQTKAGRIDPRNPKTYIVLRNVLDKSEREVFNKLI